VKGDNVKTEAHATLRTKNTRPLILAVAALLFALSLSLVAAQRKADVGVSFPALYQVNQPGDAPDADPSDFHCDVLPTFTGQQCTLRAAIQQSNAATGPAIIHFDIPDTFGTGVKTISPGTQLPDITDTVTIDGYSQPGASANTLAGGTNAKLMVQLDGSKVNTGGIGLMVGAPDVVVKGLVINRFFSDGVSVGAAASNTRVEGNFIGSDPSGTIQRGNSYSGVFIVDLAGETNNTVGGPDPADRNLISGNGIFGIAIVSNTSNEVSGNLIGTQRDGKSPLGNDHYGVYLQSTNTVVGRTAPGYANTIAFNGDDGIAVTDQYVGVVENSITSNSIFSNDGLGIDLGFDGVTPNDTGDADTGPNNLQNHPALSSAKKSASGTITVKGKLNSAPNRTFFVQYFSNPKGTNEGKKLLYSQAVATDGSGNASIGFTTTKKVSLGQNITATATDSTGDTSEFSASRKVVAA
jgi:hypothetical protein